jgi:hypothetical protein
VRLRLARWLCRLLTNDLASYHEEENDYHAWLVPDNRAHR